MRRADAERPDSDDARSGPGRGRSRRQTTGRPLRADASRRAACLPRAAGEARTRARSPRRHRATGGRRSRSRDRRRRAAEARCEQQHREPADPPEARRHPRPGARPRAPGAEAPSMPARRRASTSSNRSPRPAWASPRSDSAGREREHAPPPPARGFDGGGPERRFPDPGLALQRDRDRSLGGHAPVEHGVQRAEVFVPADDFDCHVFLRGDRVTAGGKSQRPDACSRVIHSARNGSTIWSAPFGPRPRTSSFTSSPAAR